ncbi:MAG: hypothetical protein RI885_1475 [Actinomycetota bacterium]
MASVAATSIGGEQAASAALRVSARSRRRRERLLAAIRRRRRKRQLRPVTPKPTTPPAAPPAPAPAPVTGFSAAAKAATGVGDGPENHAHLLGRATFGARASDLASLTSIGIDQWLAQQLSPASLPDPDGDAAWSAFPLSRLSISRVISSVKEFNWDAAQETAQATLGAQIFSSRQLFEVVADVFANGLNVTTPSDSVWATGTDYQVSVIRKHAFGRYADMLHDAMRHPAMLTYLNNNESTKTNVNENLGRELLELHTIGLASGYTEADVRNSAQILSGRQIDWKTNEFVYNPDDHYTGQVTTGWFSDPNPSGTGGLDVGDAYVLSLARHPGTAATVAKRLAVRFISDAPPQAVLDKLAAVYLENDTAIVPVLTALFESVEFWSARGAKWRRPLEDAVGAARAMGVTPTSDLASGVRDLFWAVDSMGHAPLGWVPPNGFPDVAAAWMSASQMVSRWNLHRGLADGWWKGLKPPQELKVELAPAGRTNAAWVDAVAQRVLGRSLTPEHTAVLVAYLGVDGSAVANDWDDWKAAQLAALVLDSPHFQLR